jgi:hypothetical protein
MCTCRMSVSAHAVLHWWSSAWFGGVETCTPRVGWRNYADKKGSGVGGCMGIDVRLGVSQSSSSLPLSPPPFSFSISSFALPLCLEQAKPKPSVPSKLWPFWCMWRGGLAVREKPPPPCPMDPRENRARILREGGREGGREVKYPPHLGVIFYPQR